MSKPQMKPPKPARIKGSVLFASLADTEADVMLLHVRQSYIYTPSKVIVLPIDNPDALVEQVARAIDGGSWTYDALSDEGREHYRESARAALRSIGVPLKRTCK